MRAERLWGWAVACLLLAACGDGTASKKTKKGDAPEGLSARPMKPEHGALVRRFADAIVRKDYAAAYEAMSEDYRRDVGWEEFEKSIRRYRDSTDAVPTYGVWATEDDPKNIQEDGVVELFVPEAMRSRIVEEAAIHFDVKGREDEEGFWALVCWLVEENGAPRILNYYQDD